MTVPKGTADICNRRRSVPQGIYLHQGFNYFKTITSCINYGYYGFKNEKKSLKKSVSPEWHPASFR